MKVECFASSSAGNCFVFDFGTHTRLMVECGVPYRQILNECLKRNIDFVSIKNCLITHAHKDHCLSAKEIQDRNVKIWCSKDTLDILKVQGNVLELEKPNRIEDDLFVLPFKVEHDIDGAIGFVIKSLNETILFVNDCKYFNTNLVNFKFDYVFIECNFEPKMVFAQYYDLKKQLKDMSLSDPKYKEIENKIMQHERNINSHMSLAGTVRTLKTLNLSKCKRIFLMHLSDNFANEYKMKNEIMSIFQIPTSVCKKIGGIK